MKALELLVLEHKSKDPIPPPPPAPTSESSPSKAPSRSKRANDTDGGSSIRNKKSQRRAPSATPQDPDTTTTTTTATTTTASSSSSSPPSFTAVIPPSPPSAYTSPWYCKNCTYTEPNFALYYCSMCSAPQPPKNSDNPIVLDGAGSLPVQSQLKSKGASANDAIDLISSDEEEEVESPPAVKKEYPKVGFGEADQPPDVVEVARPDWAKSSSLAPPPPPPAANQPASAITIDDDGDGGDDLMVLGSTGTFSADMPHSRCDCPVHSFKRGRRDYSCPTASYNFTKEEADSNKLFCKNCFCFVCQKRAPCAHWFKPKLLKHKHCNGHSMDLQFQRARDFLSNPFADALESSAGPLPSAKGASEAALVPSDISSALTSMRSVNRSVSRSIERFETGDRVRSENGMPSDLSSFMAMLGGGFGYDSDDGYSAQRRTHNFKTVYNSISEAFDSVKNLLPAAVLTSNPFPASTTNTWVDKENKRKYLLACMRLANALADFFKAVPDLPEPYRSNPDHTLDSQTAKLHKQLEETALDLYARFVLSPLCSSKVQIALKASLANICSSTRANDKLKPLEFLLETRWEPYRQLHPDLVSKALSSPSKRIALESEIRAAVDSWRPDPEPQQFQLVRSEMLAKASAAGCLFYRKLIGDLEGVIEAQLLKITANPPKGSAANRATEASKMFLGAANDMLTTEKISSLRLLPLFYDSYLKAASKAADLSVKQASFVAFAKVFLRFHKIANDLCKSSSKPTSHTIMGYAGKRNNAIFLDVLSKVIFHALDVNVLGSFNFASFTGGVYQEAKVAIAPALNPELPPSFTSASSAGYVLLALLGMYCSISDVVVDPGCGRPGCDCGSEDEVRNVLSA